MTRVFSGLTLLLEESTEGIQPARFWGPASMMVQQARDWEKEGEVAR